MRTVSDGEQEESATPSSLSWQDIAEIAYRAYSSSTGNKNFRGEPMPEFKDLPDAIKTAWEASVRQTGATLEYLTEQPYRQQLRLHLLDVTRWENWGSPSINQSPSTGRG